MVTTNSSLTTTPVNEESTVILTEVYLRYVYIVIGSLGMLGNIFVVVVIFSYTGMRKQLTNTYIINQSMVDATVALFLILTSVLENDGRVFDSAADSAYCKYWLTKMWLWGFLVSSTYNLLALTFERYLAVVHPIWHKMKFTKVKVRISIAFVWVFGPAYNMAYMVPTSGITTSGDCTLYFFWPGFVTQRAVGVLTIFIQYIFPLMTLTFCYARMVYVLRRRSPQEDKSQVVSMNAETKPKEPKKTDSMARARKNILKTLAMVAFSFIFCWTWNQIYFLMFNLGYKGVDFTSNFYHFTVVMVFCNCCINPFIYIAKYEQFQRAMKKMFCPRRTSEVSDITTVTSTVQ